MRLKSIPRRVCESRDLGRGSLFRHSVAIAALAMSTRVAGVEWAAEFFNPNPDKEDLVLPMPCGGAMAFRKVSIPNQGLLNDYAITLGGADDSVGFSENPRQAYIAGSFAQGDRERYYLIGKYEVNRLQYESMGEPCPTASADKRLPQTQIGWFEAVASADRYNLWLRKNAADQLPKDGQELGFLRLPTEEEWEFAARGGLKISAADFSERVFPMPEGIARYVWYGGTDSANGKSQFIGLLKPNPLGIHDILGNVDEIVLEPYRLNRLNRLHGQSGGFVVRGGNYFTPEPEVRSAYRFEVPYYKGAAPRRSETTGFRLALMAPVISSRERLKSIKQAWSELGTAVPSQAQAPAVGEKALEDPVQELGAISEATADANMKKRLKSVQNALRASIQERDDQRRLAAKAALRLGSFLCQKLLGDGRAVDDLEAIIIKRESAFGADDQRAKEYRERLKGERSILSENLQYYAETILGSAAIYDEEVLASQLAVLTTELSGKGYQDLIAFAKRYHAHLAEYRKQAKISRSGWLADCKSVNKG